ncbi:MAG: FAD-dependent oxidoreductase [Clostridia bacterium]|nr:FAD-dependent oxidoreductase [Clostridia bacterium]
MEINIRERVKVMAEADLCVVGGSATGVFAAVRAARLGAKVILLEKENCLGGTATTGLVNVWHSLHDTEHKNQVIGGLTYEMIERLDKLGVLQRNKEDNVAYRFNSQELKIELDRLVKEEKIRLALHTYYSGVVTDGDEIRYALFETKDGRRAVKAAFFIDATGDGLLARDLGLVSYRNDVIQPPSACFLMQGNFEGVDIGKLIHEHGSEVGLPDDWGWSSPVPGLEGISMRADNHVFGLKLDHAEDLTKAELEGREQMRRFVTLLKKYGRKDTNYALVTACQSIGIRDSIHYQTIYQASEKELLAGTRYPHPAINGSYRVDIHHAEDMGITFRYLDGREVTAYGKNTRVVRDNWREREGLTGDPATYYQVPIEVMIGKEYKNFVAAGRMINADPGAFGALRVMVNLNQMGEAAGVLGYHAVSSGKRVSELDLDKVVSDLRRGGSIL